MTARTGEPSGGAGAVGESASAATHGRIQSRYVGPSGQPGLSRSTWRSKTANTARASPCSPWPKTAARISYQASAPMSGGSCSVSVSTVRSVSDSSTARPARTYSAGASRAHMLGGRPPRCDHASSTWPRCWATTPAIRWPSASVCSCRSSDSAIACARPGLPSARKTRTSASRASSSARPRSSVSTSAPRDSGVRVGRAPPAGGRGAGLRAFRLRRTRRATPGAMSRGRAQSRTTWSLLRCSNWKPSRSAKYSSTARRHPDHM